MKQALLTFIALWTAITAIQAEDYTYLTVQQADGSTATIATASLTLTVADGHLVVTDGNTNQSFTLSGLDRMYFAKSPDVTIPAVGWATFYTDCTLDVTNASVKAYTADFSATSVTLTQVTQIPARTGFILSGSAADLTLPVTSTTTTALDGNDLLGTSEALSVSGDGYYALRANDDGTKVGFAKVESQVTIPANKAYYVTTASNAPDFFAITDDDTSITGIKTIDNGQLTMDNEIFDLQGRRVTSPGKGLYIVNGRKVIIK